MTKLKPIAQQVVAIVGASSGIGRETALKFAAKGAKVIVAARSEPGLLSLVEEIEAAKGEATYILADVSDFQQVKAIADKAVATYGRLDTWVHAAATGILAPFEQITPEEFKRVIDVVLMGQVYGAMAALPYLKQEGRGALIHISSLEGRRSLPLQSPYSSAKHGLEGFLESLRVELQHENIPISVTSILPAVINTPYYNKVKTKLGVKPTGIPPYYQPSLVADAILYAAEHPTRDYIVGDVGRVLDLLQRLSPSLVDTLLVLVGFQGQRTKEVKSEDAPNNVFAPITGYDKVEGDFRHWTIPSFTEWLEKILP
ncbi:MULTISPECIES: SDR family oxidoreductase [Chroococcidiopsis]|uniref:Short-chain dehydrogenase/reductase SDR n=1 Tax=Chroococcidiopsis thermalis (strain PCC 7203) TaxID=251229 RepID=K9TXM5_CHRTP|nr:MULTISPECIES: SDR family oxidoreductase [Chroococcidiopsis]AFY87587.1 short-chain dehydrogenase/reductase SDR [Chroococcidiopsis thermalis PCC 7203]MBE9015670.1 SDR family oxidoreductase [Chroococcidiopsidales cyanobacterium LEGE 13417]PSM49674.1 KR domain-containing protein [Chroococcidiopsis sp. CCALA 051]